MKNALLALVVSFAITDMRPFQAPVTERPIALPPVRQAVTRLMVEPIKTPTNLIKPIRCPHCGERAYIILRRLDALKRDRSEVWTFQCVNGHNTDRSGR
jgi:hypothetical protein